MTKEASALSSRIMARRTCSSALERAGIAGLREGQKVAFDTRNDPRNGKTAVGTIELA
jgi:hypothetical protein